MADEPRKQKGGKQPISRHPLFPATVALWFAALFGMGSLAIRPGLLESAVLATGIDAFIPAAAPPLGSTARIMVALAMAGIGGVIGALLARRIARPKPPVVERKRGAGSVAELRQASLGVRETAAEPVAAPTPVESEQDEELDEAERATETKAAAKRRQLAMSEDTRRPDYEERAPLPGGGPNIFNVSEFDLDGFEAESDEDEPIDDFEALEERAANYSRVQAALREPAVPEGAQVFQPDPEVAREPTKAPAVTFPPKKTAFGPIAGTAHGGGFANAPKAAPLDAPREVALANTAASQDLDERADTAASPLESRLFDTFAQEAFEPKGPVALEAGFEPEADDFEGAEPGFSELPRLSGGGTKDDNASDPQSSFDSEPAKPLFGEPAAPAPFGQPAEQNDADGEAAFGETADDIDGFWDDAEDDATEHAEFESDVAADAATEGFEPAEPTPIAAETVEETEVASKDEAVEVVEAGESPEAVEAPAIADSDQDAAAERIANADLGELNHVELLERLAMTLERRRQQQAAPAVVAAAPETISHPAEVPEEPVAAEPVEPVVPQVFEAAPEVEAFAQPAAEPEVATTEEAEAEPEADESHDAPFAPPQAPSPSAIPAALRPVGFDPDDDDDLLPSFIPARKIGMTTSVSLEASSKETDTEEDAVDAEEPFDGASGNPQAASTEASDDGDELDEESQALEDGYSSLLSLSRPAAAQTPFVRIEEPEAEDGSIEPVVIFPGQESRNAPFAAPENPGAQAEQEEPAPAPEPAPESPSAERRFDAPPEQAGQGRQDPQETERALRAALATLQRMSGAA